jgi:tetratricopeptide (TPR) repeat protein
LIGRHSTLEGLALNSTGRNTLITICSITATIVFQLGSFDTPLLAKNPPQVQHQSSGITLSPSTVSLIRKADYWREHGEIEKAMPLYNQAIKLDRNAAAAYFGRARAWEEFGKMDKALADFTSAINIEKPFHEPAMRLRGDLYQSLRRYEDAIRDYSKVINLHPTDGLYFSRATCHLRLNKPALAVSDYNEALKIAGPRASIFEKRGDAYFVLKQDAKALADYEKALKLDPEGDESKDGHEHLHKTRAEIYKRLGKMDLYKKEAAAAAVGRNANIDLAPFASDQIK